MANESKLSSGSYTDDPVRDAPLCLHETSNIQGTRTIVKTALNDVDCCDAGVERVGVFPPCRLNHCLPGMAGKG